MPQHYAIDEFSLEGQEIARRRRLAEMLRAQGMAPLQAPPMSGNVAIRTSPLAGLAKLLQGYSAGQLEKDVGEQERSLAERMRSARSEDYEKLMQAQSAPTGINPALIAQLRSPELQQLAGQQLMKQMETARLIEALKQSGVAGGQQPAAPGQPGTPGIQTGLPPIALLGAGDMGKTIFSALNANQNAGNRIAMDQAKLAQSQKEWEGLSAYQKQQLANQGINTAIDLARARDQGINVPAQTTPIPPQQQPAQQPLAPPGGWTIPPQVQSQRDQQAQQIIGREEMPGGGGAIPSEAILSPKDQRDIARQQVEAPIKSTAAFQESLARESGKQYEELVKDSGKAGDQLDLGQNALKQFMRFRQSNLGGTGPLASVMGLRKYTNADMQALEATFRTINLKNMVATFDGMTRAIDTQAERAAWEATQPGIALDDKANTQILVGGMSLAAKTKAEGEARRAYMDQRKSLEGYVSPVIGKTTVLFNQNGDPQVVSKSQVEQARRSGLMTDQEYINTLMGGGGRSSGATGEWTQQKQQRLEELQRKLNAAQ